MRFPNLKPSTTAISIRLPVSLLEQIKIAANKRDVPYQSLIWAAELMNLPIGLLIRQRSADRGTLAATTEEFLHDALPRARSFLDKFGDIKRQLTASASCTSPDAG